MLRSLQQFYGNKLVATDAEAGSLKDFYFDDEKWAVRYVVVKSGSWLLGRLVLIAAHAFGAFIQDGDYLFVNLNRQQIDDSSATESHRPVSQRFEEEVYGGRSSYTDDREMWAFAGLPGMEPAVQRARHSGSAGDAADAHLRSAKALGRYAVHAGGQKIGHATDFLMEDTTGTIEQMVVDTGHWFAGKEILIAPKHIERISCEKSRIVVDMTIDTILKAPKYRRNPPYSRGS